MTQMTMMKVAIQTSWFWTHLILLFWSALWSMKPRKRSIFLNSSPRCWSHYTPRSTSHLKARLRYLMHALVFSRNRLILRLWLKCCRSMPCLLCFKCATRLPPCSSSNCQLSCSLHACKGWLHRQKNTSCLCSLRIVTIVAIKMGLTIGLRGN